MREKRGVSGVLVTIMLIVIVLVAVAVVWGIINNIIQTQSGEVSISNKCLNVNFQVTSLSCSGVGNVDCDVTISRSAKGEAISGVKLIFTNASGTTNYIHDVPGNIAPLGVSTSSATTAGVTNADKVEVVPYFTDASGNEQLC